MWKVSIYSCSVSLQCNSKKDNNDIQYNENEIRADTNTYDNDRRF